MEELKQSVSENKIYILAKEITQTEDEDKKIKLFENLGELVNTIFKNKKQEEIEDALQMAAEKEEIEVMDVIMDDTEVEIENISYTKEGKSYNSSMLLLSCTMVSGEKIVNIPSIMRFQTTIQDHLLKANIIVRREQFTLGAIRIDQDTIEELSMQDWWNIHRNIVDDFGTPENQKKLSSISQSDVEGGLVMFHLVPVLTLEGDEKSFLNELLDSSKYDSLWTDIGKSLSTEKVGFNIMAPDYISQGMEESKYVFQSAKLQFMIHEYQEYENIEMGYIKLKGEDEHTDTYVVFFFDNEDYSLADFFIFETDGNESEMVTMLVNEMSGFHSEKLWHFDTSITADELDTWFEDDEDNSIDLTKLIESGHTIDLNQVLTAVHGTSSKYLH